MVDIGPDGIKFEKDDLCDRIFNDILQKNKILDGLISKGKGAALGMAKENLGLLTGLGNTGLSNAQGTLDSSMSGANTSAGAVQDLKDKVLDGKLVAASDMSLKTITDCLGGALPDLGFPSAGAFLNIEQLGKIVEQLTSALLSKLAGLISNVLSPLENLISDALGFLAHMIPLDLLDQLLNIVQCIEDCPNVDHSKIPTLLNIEEKISSIGLKITGEIDWDSGVWATAGEITTEMKEQFNKVLDAKKVVTEKLASVKDIKLPEIPNLPKIPRPKNPLNGISVKEKIESLF